MGCSSTNAERTEVRRGQRTCCARKADGLLHRSFLGLISARTRMLVMACAALLLISCGSEVSGQADRDLGYQGAIASPNAAQCSPLRDRLAEPLATWQRAIGFHAILAEMADDQADTESPVRVDVAHWDGTNLFELGLPTRYQAKPVVLHDIVDVARIQRSFPSANARGPALNCPRFLPFRSRQSQT